MNFAEFWRAFSQNKGAVAGLVFMVIVGLLAIFAPWVAPHSPIEQYRDNFLQAPVWAGGSSQFLLGTDELGRDLLARIAFGGRYSLTIALLTAVAVDVLAQIRQELREIDISSGIVINGGLASNRRGMHDGEIDGNCRRSHCR